MYTLSGRLSYAIKVVIAKAKSASAYITAAVTVDDDKTNANATTGLARLRRCFVVVRGGFFVALGAFASERRGLLYIPQSVWLGGIDLR